MRRFARPQCSKLKPWPARWPTPQLRHLLEYHTLPAGTLSGEAAVQALWDLGEDHAQRSLADCAAALCLYPAWERRDWGMPNAAGVLSAHGGRFEQHLQQMPALSSLGTLRQHEGRPNVLHLSSGLVFALYFRPEQTVLILGGTNTSASESQIATLPAEAKQFRADLLNALGRLPRLFAVAAELTALIQAERGQQLPDLPLTLAGHSLGGGLVQYAAAIHGLSALAFSPTALGRAVAAPVPDAPQVLCLSLDGDPIPLLGTQHLQARLLGRHLRLPLHPEVPLTRHATSHGQIYLHLLAWLRESWPQLPSALEHSS